MPRTQCQATALEVLCRRTGPPARRWRGAGPCHGPLSHPSASGGPTDPWGRPGAAIEAHAAMHPTPRDAPDPPQGVVGDATPPASPPWDARRHPGTAASAKGHSAAPKGANGTAWPGFGTSPGRPISVSNRDFERTGRLCDRCGALRGSRMRRGRRGRGRGCRGRGTGGMDSFSTRRSCLSARYYRR